MTMSAGAKTEKTVSAEIRVTTPSDLVTELAEQWIGINGKRAVNGIRVPRTIGNSLPVTTTIDWEGGALVRTSADEVPVLTVPGMPPSEYPAHALPLIAYTLAQMSLTLPGVATYRAAPSVLHSVTVVVSVRCGVWAALGRVPDASVAVSPAALKWSRSKGKLALRKATADMQDVLWRYFLASTPALLTGTKEIARELSGVAPPLLNIGAAHLASSGGVSLVYVLERQVMAVLESRLSRPALSNLKLGDVATMTTMAAAAVGGFRANAIRQLSNDPAFVLASQLRITTRSSDRAQLKARLDSITSGYNSVGGSSALDSGDTSDTMTVISDQDSAASRDSDLDVSDSEDEMPGAKTALRPGSPAGPGAITPRQTDELPSSDPPQMSAEDAEAFRMFTHRVMKTAPVAKSAIANVNLDETVIW